MSRYIVMVKLSMKHENGTTIQAGSIDQMSEGTRLAQQVAYQSGHRGQIYVSILDTQQQNYCVQNASTFC